MYTYHHGKNPYPIFLVLMCTQMHFCIYVAMPLVFLKEFLKNLNLKKNSAYNKSMKNYPESKELKFHGFQQPCEYIALMLTGQEFLCWLISSFQLILCMLGNFACPLVVWCHFFKIIVFQNLFQEYSQSIKQFGFRSGPTFCWA